MLAELPGKCTDPMQLRQTSQAVGLLVLAPECAGVSTMPLGGRRRTYFGASKGISMWNEFCFVLRSSLRAEGLSTYHNIYVWSHSSIHFQVSMPRIVQVIPMGYETA